MLKPAVKQPKSFRSTPLRTLALAVSLAACVPAALGATATPAENSSGWAPFNSALESITGLFSRNKAHQNLPSESAPDTARLLDQPHSVQDSAYGNLLFDYYQANYFAAITRILVAQERGQLTQDAERAQVLLGALYVSYGMLDKGEAIFHDLLATQLTPQSADEAWYQLARIHYKRGNSARALELLSSQLQTTPEQRPNEHLILQILCLIEQQQTEQALALLPALKDNNSLSVYSRFNLGSAFNQLGELEKAEGYFRQVSRMDAKSETDWLLKDRATVALGVQLLKKEQWLQARQVLQNVRLYGPLSSRGLLALGWTYYNNDDPVSSLSPWLELADRDLTDPAVQEAILNIPWVYEKQGGLKEALNRYRAAYDQFGTQRDVLETAKQDILQPGWIKQISPVEESDFQEVMAAIPDFKLPTEDQVTPYLSLYFASNEFHQQYQDYRELQRLYMVLLHWKRQLPSYQHMVDSNLERLEVLGPRSQKFIDDSKDFYARARVKLEEFSNRLDDIIATDDLTGTANVVQLDQKERLDAVEQSLTALGDPAQHVQAWEKLRLVKGLLMWDMNATALDRRWEMAKNRIAIDNHLIDLEDNIRRVQAARNQRIERFEGFTGRLQDAEQRIVQLQNELAAALQDHRQQLQATALTIIEQHQIQLDRMRGKALLAIARLQDRGYVSDRERSLPPVMRKPSAVPQNEKPTPKKPLRSIANPQSLMEAIQQIFED